VILAAAVAAILGQAVPEWPPKPPTSWVQGGPLTLAGLRGKVVLLRFFMDDDCPYCRATAPSLNEFNDDFASSGLVVIGMYTPKPRPRAVTPDEVRGYVKSYGFTFPVALDADWGALHRLWLDRVPGAKFTSATLLIDRRGVLRHVQEGGAYAKDAVDPQGRKDYQELRKAIAELLAEPE
jgi:peroxiredoxin